MIEMRTDKFNLDSIESLRDSMLGSLNELDIDTLREQVEKYNHAIRETMSDLSAQELAEPDLESIKQFLIRHQQLIQGFEYKRQHVADELKKMKRGRDMQKTYQKN